MEETDGCGFLGIGRAADVDADFSGILRVDTSDEFQLATYDTFEDDGFVRGKLCFADLSMWTSQFCEGVDRLDAKLAFGIECQAPRQGHDVVLLAEVRGLAPVDVVNDQDASVAIRSGGWGVNAATSELVKVESTVCAGSEKMTISVVVTEEVLRELPSRGVAVVGRKETYIE